jgi:hypothetical protein
MIDKEKRIYDDHCEKVVAELLDKHFYGNLNLSSFERVFDKERQVQGIDTIINMDDKSYVIDEKAAIRWVGLKTFSLELSFLGYNDQVRKGWLLDEDKINTHFVFVWINELNHDTIKDITSLKDVDVALVSKESIINHLSSLGWTPERLQTKDFQIRNHDKPYMGNILKKGCKFSYSKQLKEQPINILLPKETYIELADVYKNIKIN